MIGLYAFFYATLHLLTYVLLFSGYDVPAAIAGLRAGHLMEPWTQLKMIWPTMLDDLKKRKFIQVGLAAWVILLVLAVTSPQRVLRAMGGKNWSRVHRLVYLAGALACIHYWWLVKTGVRTPWKVTAVLSVLLLMRVGYWVGKKMKVGGKPKSHASVGQMGRAESEPASGIIFRGVDVCGGCDIILADRIVGDVDELAGVVRVRP